MERKEFLDNFEKILEQGLLKVCKSADVLDDSYDVNGKVLLSPDIEDAWDTLIKDYVGDAISNFNDYPLASLGFAGFLGMAVAHWWDTAWQSHSKDAYKDYCDEKGFDSLDDHIVADILKLDEADARHISASLSSCAQATLSYIRKEQIEAQTDTGFYVLVRSFGVIFRLGAAIELKRLGYKPVVQGTGSVS